ncbi:MAG: Txe/YoeB family addiction module toxin [Rhodanobacter sp.]
MPRALMFLPDAWDDYLYWQQQDGRTLRRLNRLIGECLRTPDSGVGKPEPLRGDLSGYWSRRLNEVDRLVYRWTDAELVVIQCRGHY